MNDDDLDDLLGAYALDAVNEAERAQIEAYLVRSPTARAEVQRHHEVAAAIAASPGEAPAPLWLRIEALLDDRSPTEASLAMPELRPTEGQSKDSTQNSNPSPAVIAGSAWSPAVGPRPQTTPDREPIDEVSPRNKPEASNGWFGRRPPQGGAFVLPSGRSGRSARAGIGARLGIAFAAMAIVSLGARVVQLNGANRELQQQAAAAKREGTQLSKAAKAESQRADALAAKLIAASNRDARLEKLLASPSTKTVTLTSVSGATLAKVVVGADGMGYLLGGELPKLPPGHTYQLWGVHNPKGAAKGAATTVLSLGVFGQHPESVAFAADSNDPWQTFALTDEQSPGVVTSKQPAVAAGNVEAA
jgi:hypothetical protein